MTDNDAIYERLRILEEYVYRLEKEVSELTRELIMWRMRNDPSYPHPDEQDPF